MDRFHSHLRFKVVLADHQIAGRKIGLVAMSDHHWEIVRDHVTAIAAALHKGQTG